MTTRMNVSLYGICVHTAITAELTGHKCVDGDNWKSVADEVLVYNRNLTQYEILKLNDTPIPYELDGFEDIESIIRINYSGYSSDVSRFDNQNCTWEPCTDAKYIICHELVMNNPEDGGILYWNDDIETVVTTIMSLFDTIYFND